MMFDLRVCPSLESLPGRVVNLCWDEEEMPDKALPKPKQTLEERREYDRMRHARDREMRNAAALERYRNRTPEQARMPLLYAPYVPSLWEDFILRNRRILADQMEFLMAHLPKTSRLHC